MDKLFTVEEINLMCLFDTQSRKTLIESITQVTHKLQDNEMIEIAVSAIAKLETIGDDEFSEIGFYLADDFDSEVE